jgi:hypothetical protein
MMQHFNPRTAIVVDPCIEIRLLFVVIFCMLFSTSSLAVDCPNQDYSFTNQTQIDSFVSDNGVCDHINGNLYLDTGTFSSLAGIAGIVSIGGNLEIARSNVPAPLGLTNLLNIDGSLRIQSTLSPTFSSLAGLSSLITLGGLSISDSSHITSLSGMPSLASLDSLRLHTARTLTNFTGLPAGLDMIKIISIESAELLQTLDGLGPVNGILELLIEGNPKLTSIGALAGSTFDDSYGHPFEAPRLSIGDNLKLASLDGVPAILAPGVFTGLEIYDNPMITSLAVLDGLVEVWGEVGIYRNGALSDCSALSRVVDAIDDGFTGPNEFSSDPTLFPPDVFNNSLYLAENATGCNSIAEIIGNGGGDGVFADSFETGLNN